MDDLLPATEAAILRWHAIAAPNDPARRLTAELTQLIAAFAALRGTPDFEDEPASFDAALRATMDPAP